MFPVPQLLLGHLGMHLYAALSLLASPLYPQHLTQGLTHNSTLLNVSKLNRAGSSGSLRALWCGLQEMRFCGRGLPLEIGDLVPSPRSVIASCVKSEK